MCDPGSVDISHVDICEDLWEALCNPDDELPVDDEFCDWIGFTPDVDWNDTGDLVYAKYGGVASSSSSGDRARTDQFGENMCDPSSVQHRDEGVCDDIWEALCNPDDKLQVDDEFCDWIGLVEWNDYEEWDSYDSYDTDYDRRGHGNLRG